MISPNSEHLKIPADNSACQRRCQELPPKLLVQFGKIPATLSLRAKREIFSAAGTRIKPNYYPSDNFHCVDQYDR